MTLDEVLVLERAGWDSLCRSQGATFYGDLMTADAVMIVVGGMVLDRAAVARSLDDAPPWSTYEISEIRLVHVGDAGAALVYRAEATRAGQSEPFAALMTSVYAVVDGRPRLTLYQQTAISG